MQVLISNGSNKFHLAPLAAELDKAGALAGLLTAGWPTAMTEFMARPFSGHPGLRRFLDRKEAIPVGRIHASQFSEVLFQLGIRLRRISEHTEQRFDWLAFWWYARHARNVLRRLRPDIYHYRACYGLGSVPFAKQLGIPTLCDHSIAHPGVLQYMTDNQGAWPSAPVKTFSSLLQQLMSCDIQAADHVLVNSDFVKQTCVFCGVPAERVHVVYLGVDEKFLQAIPAFDAKQVLGRAGSPLLFAGGLQRRKGAVTLAKAYLSLPAPTPITLLAGVDRDMLRQRSVKTFLEHPSVNHCGIVARAELARQMTQSAIFVFPSHCEGSARVIFEAMACGCFVITTPNAGSIVQDGEHGLIVPSGDAAALATALQRASANPEWVAQIGWRNAQLVRDCYRQSHYAEKSISVYRQLLQEQH